MERYTLILWLVLRGGPEVTLDVNDCSYDAMKPWLADARDWAKRSGLDPHNVGYFCYEPQRWRFVKARGHDEQR